MAYHKSKVNPIETEKLYHALDSIGYTHLRRMRVTGRWNAPGDLILF
jgi:hypothetical protein